MCASDTLLGLCRKTEEMVDELFQDGGPYKPIEFKQKYAKQVIAQYTVRSP